jgi:hypothetical protein
MGARREAVSIICAFNDSQVRRRCLDASIEALRHEATNVEYLPVDNTNGAFATAGAALNHGASLATNDCLVFVHQDVYLHSLRTLEEAAGMLAEDGTVGLLGATGVLPDGRNVGRIRDRVVLLGEPARTPTDVDSLDEVLFMAPRELIQREPLSEEPDLAWHAYAIEYGLRLRRLGLRVCALDLSLTHNSLTVNLDKLDVAYAAIAAKYPDTVPVQASCGVVAPPTRQRPGARLLRPHRWRYGWLKESMTAHAARRAAGGGLCVLGDIRRDIDDVISRMSNRPLLVVNLDRESGFEDDGAQPLALERRGHPIGLVSRPMDALADVIASWRPGSAMLITNLEVADLRRLAPRLPRGPRVIGLHDDVGCWVLLGVEPAGIPAQWRAPRARPLGLPAPGR